ncbi:uncharacterized protein LOC130737477 [Lotus japonicus]|uniref:uncharacterized protein LOC130737477 n=1 Tax=Lotus japonicus TaxID=34305 RepID=UPI0025903D93|nr:uncharacterized protein LOC130737477 [Lotus japonicus]XP_057445230.1 uncharacterized protein LOC130737477 [Lotus japonicus]XP_057445231.1 uncharacterized protein LOC130737477 [Lotus japonicus]
MFQHVFYMNCSNPVRDDPLYVDTDISPCSSVNSQDHHVYAVVGDMKVGNFKPHCHLNLVTPVSVDREIHEQAFSYGEIHSMLEFGFELSWMSTPCQHLCRYPEDCYLNQTTNSLQCDLSEFVELCLSPLGIQITCHTGPHIFGILKKGRIFLEDEHQEACPIRRMLGIWKQDNMPGQLFSSFFLQVWASSRC